MVVVAVAVVVVAKVLGCCLAAVWMLFGCCSSAAQLLERCFNEVVIVIG